MQPPQYWVSLPELSATERNEYFQNLNLLLEGNLEGLMGICKVLGESRPLEGRATDWAKNIIFAYRNVGRALSNIVIEPSIPQKLTDYETILSGDSEQNYGDRVLATLNGLVELFNDHAGELDYQNEAFIEILDKTLTDYLEIKGVMRGNDIDDAKALEARLEQDSQRTLEDFESSF